MDRFWYQIVSYIILPILYILFWNNKNKSCICLTIFLLVHCDNCQSIRGVCIWNQKQKLRRCWRHECSHMLADILCWGKKLLDYIRLVQYNLVNLPTFRTSFRKSCSRLKNSVAAAPVNWDICLFNYTRGQMAPCTYIHTGPAWNRSTALSPANSTRRIYGNPHFQQ